jgi:uncharacterized glyoxalase superfamily protein PhnB
LRQHLAASDNPHNRQSPLLPCKGELAYPTAQPTTSASGELDEAFNKLSAGGTVLMPLDNYSFSTKFGWLNDRFGVSWQLNLA